LDKGKDVIIFEVSDCSNIPFEEIYEVILENQGFIGKVIECKEGILKFKIHEVHIEKRLYKRFVVEDKNIHVKLGSLKGKLIDISFGGLKIQPLENNEDYCSAILRDSQNFRCETLAEFSFPNGKKCSAAVQLRYINPRLNYLGFEFVNREEALKVLECLFNED
jgi:hypothetical protein